MEIDFDKKSVLLRYVSEWDPRSPGKTKGGYMEGKIRGVPPGARRMVLQTIPDQEYAMKMDRELAQFGLQLGGSVHCLLLHVVRMGKGKRANELEPVPTFYHWRQEFIIDQQDKVRIINLASELDLGRDIPVSADDPRSVVTSLTNDGCIVLGGKRGELNLIALQPKQDGRAKLEEATLTKVLRDRLRTDNKHLIEGVEKLFKKVNSSNLKMFRIRADFYDETGHHIGSTISETIKDTGNKKSGAMDLHDVSAQRSCCRGGRKIFMESEYSLAKDVRPVFQVYDEAGNHWPEDDQKLNQPAGKQVKVRNNAIHIITPEQQESIINQLALDNKHIELLFKRDSDGYCSPNKFWFQYDPHPRAHCLFCYFYPDTTCEGEKPDLASGLEPPKPRKVKRVLQPEERKNRLKVPRIQTQMSPSSSYSSSPFSSPEHLPPSPSSPDSGCGYSDSDMFSDCEKNLKEMIGTEAIPVPAGMKDIAYGLFAMDAPGLETQDIPTVLDTYSTETSTEETLNTPQLMIEPFNSLSRSLNPYFEPGERSAPFVLTRREDVVTDCAVQQERRKIKTIQPDHHHELQGEQERRPTLRVEPWKREIGTTLDTKGEEEKEEEEEEEEEEGKRGNPLLSHLPILVTVLILVVMVASVFGMFGLATLISVGVGAVALYQRYQGVVVPPTSFS